MDNSHEAWKLDSSGEWKRKMARIMLDRLIIEEAAKLNATLYDLPLSTGEDPIVNYLDETTYLSKLARGE